MFPTEVWHEICSHLIPQPANSEINTFVSPQEPDWRALRDLKALRLVDLKALRNLRLVNHQLSDVASQYLFKHIVAFRSYWAYETTLDELTALSTSEYAPMVRSLFLSSPPGKAENILFLKDSQQVLSQAISSFVNLRALSFVLREYEHAPGLVTDTQALGQAPVALYRILNLSRLSNLEELHIELFTAWPIRDHRRASAKRDALAGRLQSSLAGVGPQIKTLSIDGSHFYPEEASQIILELGELFYNVENVSLTGLASPQTPWLPYSTARLPPWTKLQSLCLRDASMDAHSLVNFMKRSQNSLKTIKMENIELAGGSRMDIVNTLETFEHLQDVSFTCPDHGVTSFKEYKGGYEKRLEQCNHCCLRAYEHVRDWDEVERERELEYERESEREGS